MKQTDYYKPSLQDISPRDTKSPHIYDVQPQTYEKSSHIYDIKKSPDYDVPPSSSSKAVILGGVSRRMKKGEASHQPRPKSWHNSDPSQARDDQTVRHSSIPVAQQPPSRPATAGQVSPHHHQRRAVSSSPPKENLTVLRTFHARPMSQSNTKSMSNLQGFQDETEVDPGFVKRRVSALISTSTRELSSAGKDKDFYFVKSEKKGGTLFPYNPTFRNVELQPAETYPKVAMATQLQSAQQRAFIGRVPDMQTPPESQQQTYSTSQVVSYSTVQMPQRQYASSADIHVGGKYWDDSTQSYQHTRMSPTSGPVYHAIPRTSPSPTPSERREPPKPPQRGDSRNKAHQIGEHMKSSSWQVPITNTQESRGNDNNCTPNSVISPTDLSPVKLSSKPEPQRPVHSKNYSMSGDLYPSYSEQVFSSTTAAPVYATQQQENGEVSGSVTFPGMSNKISNKQESLYTATYCFVESSADGTETDTNSWFSNSNPQDIQMSPQTSYEYPQRGSPPTRDNVDRITEETDPLISAFQSYMQTVTDHEERMIGVNPEESSTGSESPTHQPHMTLYSSESTRQQPQTLPTYVARNENEKRLSRTSESSLDSHSSSHRVKSPTNRLSSDEEEQNRKNSQLGNINQRTWKNPNDFSNKKAVTTPDEQWQKIVLSVDSKWSDKYPEPEGKNVPKKSHINEKLIRENAPGIRSPISPLMMEAVTTIEPAKPETSLESQQKEIIFLKTEGRDSGYEVDSENTFRSQQEFPNPVQSVTESFSSEDWKKIGKIETPSIISMLQSSQNQFSQQYVNNQQGVKATGNHETTVEIKIDGPYSSPTSESNRQHTKGQTSSTNPHLSRPQSTYQPNSNDTKRPGNQSSKEARDNFFGSHPQLSTQSGTNASSRHYHTTSLDLDTRMSGSQVVTHSSFPPWKPEGSEEPTSEVSSHYRSHSHSGGFYPSHGGPSERFSRIDEEQGGESSDLGSTTRSRPELDRRSASVSLTRSRSSIDGNVKDNRRSTSDPKSLDLAPHKSSSDMRGRCSFEDSDLTTQHKYSKSDSEQYRKGPAAEHWHKTSDPSGAIRKSHRASDPEGKSQIKDSLSDFYHAKKGLSQAEESNFGSQQGNLSGYSSMQSLDQYSSNNSLHRRRDQSIDHSRQSSTSSQASHAHRDSGIVSPVEATWNPHSPKTSPPGVDHKQRSQQRPPPVLDNHQRAVSESTSPVDRARNNTWQRSSQSMDDYQPTKKSVTVKRSASVTHTSRRRPPNSHVPRMYNREDYVKGVARTETNSVGQRPPSVHSQKSATLPATRSYDNNTKQQLSLKDYGQQYPSKMAPSAEMTRAEIDEDEPPKLPPKQVTYKSPASSYKVKEAQLITIAKVYSEDDYIKQESDRERRTSAPARAVFTFQSSSPQNPKRYPSPKTSPTHTPDSKDSSPSHQVNTPLWPGTNTLTQLDTFDLPPPPTPPANQIIVNAELGGDLPPPPPEVLSSFPLFHKEDREVVEEPVTQSDGLSTHAAISFPPAKQESHPVSPSRSSPKTSTHSPVDSEERLPVSADLDIDPEVRGRSWTPKSEVSDPDLQPQEVILGSSCDFTDSGDFSRDINDTPSFQSRITGSPTNRRVIQDLDLDDEAGPIEVVEIVQTPTLSPRGAKRCLPGDEEESQKELVDWVLHSLNPQDSSLRELFQFPEEPVELCSRTIKKMPHENKKKAEPQSPKRSEYDVKSLTHALSSSLYLQISPAKALLLTRARGMLGSDMVQGDSVELKKTKEELIGRIDRKVSELTKEKYELQEEINTLEDLGRQVTDNVKKSCKASSLDKYLMYVGDAERVTKLLLSLSRRLTKVNSVLNSLEGNDDEEQKADLKKMHKDLTSKYEDAKGLKVSIDDRHVQISSMLQDHLSTEEYEDFCHFVPMRSRLRIMAQELDDRITLGEEQLQALKDSMKDERSPGERSLLSLDVS